MAARVLDEFVNKLGFQYDKKGMDAFKRGVKSAAKGAAVIGAAILGAASAAALFGIKSAKVADETSKFSRQVGVGAEALQELEFVADRQGVSNDKLRMSFQFLNRALANARRGQGLIKSAFEKSNPALLSQLTLAKDTEDAFNIFVKAVEKAPDAITKAGIANTLFGRSGQVMLRVAEAGTAGIKDLREEARALGGVMALKVLKMAEEVIDKLTNFKFAIKGITNTISAVLFPILIKTGNLFEKWWKANKKIINQKLDIFIKKLSKGWLFFMKILKPFLKKYKEIGKAFKDMFKDVRGQELLKSYLDYLMSIFNLIKAFSGLVSAVIKPAFMALKPLIQLFDLILQPILKAVTLIIDKITEFTEALTDTLNKLGSIYKGMFGKIFEGFKKIAGKKITAADLAVFGGGEGGVGNTPAMVPAMSAAGITNNRETVNNNIHQEIKIDVKSTDPKAVGDEIEERFGRIQENTIMNIDKGGFS